MVVVVVTTIDVFETEFAAVTAVVIVFTAVEKETILSPLLSPEIDVFEAPSKMLLSESKEKLDVLKLDVWPNIDCPVTLVAVVGVV